MPILHKRPNETQQEFEERATLDFYFAERFKDIEDKNAYQIFVETLVGKGININDAKAIFHEQIARHKVNEYKCMIDYKWVKEGEDKYEIATIMYCDIRDDFKEIVLKNKDYQYPFIQTKTKIN